MRTTPRSFLEVFVRPNYWDYCACPDDIRLGFNAAVPAFQLADIYLTFYRKENPGVVRPWTKTVDLLKHLSEIEPSFLTVQSVATAYKHLYPKADHYEIGSPGALWKVSFPDDAMQLEADWSADKVDVLVRRRDGSVVSLSEALEKVVEQMWPTFLPAEQ